MSESPLLRVTPEISIDEAELEERYIRASGPGGQNVNKVATAVQLRFNLIASHSVSEEVRARAAVLAGRRLTNDGFIVIAGQRFRSRERNREDVRERLAQLLRRAANIPAKRRKTRPPKASLQKRLESKIARGRIKLARAKPRLETP